MFLVNAIARLIFLLHSAAAPSQLAAGFVLGMIIGFTPSLPINALVVLMIIIINVNLGAALLAMLVFRALAYVIDPLLHGLGSFLLIDLEPLNGMWTFLYNTPFVPYTGFNNTVVLGSIVLSLLLIVPVYMASVRMVFLYRRDYADKVRKLPVVKAIRASFVYGIYQRLRMMGEQVWK